MEKFWVWFAASPIAAALRVAAGVTLSNALAEWQKVGTFDMSNWKSWVLAGVIVATPIILRWINPEDKAFGMKSQ